ncbi:hypothetical protein B0H19DRAFT_1063375 [Mycena capillaripes]|nr:hypothetical protein B0H19DRAFT_1063375 [Mycena capillaripes]
MSKVCVHSSTWVDRMRLHGMVIGRQTDPRSTGDRNAVNAEVCGVGGGRRRRLGGLRGSRGRDYTAALNSSILEAEKSRQELLERADPDGEWVDDDGESESEDEDVDISGQLASYNPDLARAQVGSSERSTRVVVV